MKKLFTDLFTRPSYEKVVSKERDEALLALLKAEEALEYATAFVAFNKAKIARLTKKSIWQ